MSKLEKTNSNNETLEVEVPYEKLGPLASLIESREFAVKRSRETLLYDFSKIRQREGFNTRVVYRGIPELAESIKANGLITPLSCDILKDGTALVEKGNRRFKALQRLWEDGWLQIADKPGVVAGAVEIFRNDAKVTEVDRSIGIITSNTSDPLSAYESYATIERHRNIFKHSVKEIAALTGFSRQQVENMLILAKEPDEIKEAIEHGIMKPTTAVALARLTDNNDVKLYIARQHTAGGSIVKQSSLKGLVETAKITLGIVDAPPEAPARACRVCKCTEEDCSQCIAAQGFACSWVEYDLCSRCQDEAVKNAMEAFIPTMKKLQADHQNSDESWWRSRWYEWLNYKGDDSPDEHQRKHNLERLFPLVFKRFAKTLTGKDNASVTVNLVYTDADQTKVGFEPSETGNVVLHQLPEELEENNEGNDDQFSEEVITHPPVEHHKVIPANDDIEMQQANRSTKPQTYNDNTRDQKINDIKEEEIWCSEIAQMLDQVYIIITKLPAAQAQAAKDIQIKLDACLHRVASVKLFVKKAEIRSKD